MNGGERGLGVGVKLITKFNTLHPENTPLKKPRFVKVNNKSQRRSSHWKCFIKKVILKLLQIHRTTTHVTPTHGFPANFAKVLKHLFHRTPPVAASVKATCKVDLRQ